MGRAESQDLPLSPPLSPPSKVWPLASLPQLPNGKLDRRLMASMAQSGQVSRPLFLCPERSSECVDRFPVLRGFGFPQHLRNYAARRVVCCTAARQRDQEEWGPPRPLRTSTWTAIPAAVSTLSTCRHFTRVRVHAHTHTHIQTHTLIQTGTHHTYTCINTGTHVQNRLPDAPAHALMCTGVYTGTQDSISIVQ